MTCLIINFHKKKYTFAILWKLWSVYSLILRVKKVAFLAYWALRKLLAGNPSIVWTMCQYWNLTVAGWRAVPVLLPRGATPSRDAQQHCCQVSSCRRGRLGFKGTVSRDFCFRFFSWLKFFSICHRCRWYRWCTLSCEYLREFSERP